MSKGRNTSGREKVGGHRRGFSLTQDILSAYRSGEYSSAINKARELVALEPHNHEGWKFLGIAQVEQRSESPIDALDRAAKLAPEDPEIPAALAKYWFTVGDYVAAIEHGQQASRLNPSDWRAPSIAARACYELRRIEDGMQLIDLAESLAPTNPQVLLTKALLLKLSNRHSESLAYRERLAEIDPDSGDAYFNLGNLYKDVGLFEKSEECYQKAVSLGANSLVMRGSRLASAHYNPKYDGEQLFRGFAEIHQSLLPPAVYSGEVNKDPDQKPRVGLLSDGFRSHPVGHMTTAALEHLAGGGYELYFYSTSNIEDNITKRLREVAARWIPVSQLTDDELYQRMLTDELGILIDMCGYGAGSRVDMLLKKPAPVQMKWVGNLINTTGLPTMDYLISDWFETPAGSDSRYFEKLIRLPHNYVSYEAPKAVPAVSDQPPVCSRGHVTFGCFNNPAKLSQPLFEQWAKVLRQVPDSRLLLKGAQFDSAEMRDRVVRQFVELGIKADRLMIEDASPHDVLLSRYNEIDIALDPAPYTGGLSTCEALLMGVPVVALEGDTFAGRHSTTHLNNAGLPELVTKSWDEYVELAVSLAGDIERLQSYKSTLRVRLLAAPMCDARLLAEHLHKAFTVAWMGFCEGRAPAGISVNADSGVVVNGSPLPDPGPLRADDSRSAQLSLERPVFVLDSGARLIQRGAARELDGLSFVNTIILDPQGVYKSQGQMLGPCSNYFFGYCLGDGRDATYFVRVDPSLNSTSPTEGDAAGLSQVLAKLPIKTVTIDELTDFPAIDWLLIGPDSDAELVLRGATQSLAKIGLISYRCRLRATAGDSSPWEIARYLETKGFEIHHIGDPVFSMLEGSEIHTSEMQDIELTFVPVQSRLESMDRASLLSLATVARLGPGLVSFAHRALQLVDPELATAVLANERKVAVTNRAQEVDSSPALPTAPHMSPGERALFAKALDAATHYFEYGSGGSTIWAADRGLVVYGVESDGRWVEALKQKVGERCQVEAVDIGPLKEWGFPASDQYRERYPQYSSAIERHDTAFDLILVDGRFRVSCVIAAVRHTLVNSSATAGTKIFIHDFWNRVHYHKVLEFLVVEERCDTAGLFTIKPDVDIQTLEKAYSAYCYEPA